MLGHFLFSIHKVQVIYTQTNQMKVVIQVVKMMSIKLLCIVPRGIGCFGFFYFLADFMTAVTLDFDDWCNNQHAPKMQNAK